MPLSMICGSHRLLHQHLAALADPLAAHMALHEELGGDDVEPLAHVFADAHHGLAASRCRAGGALGFVAMQGATRLLGQGLATGLALGLRCSSLSHRNLTVARLPNLKELLIDQMPLLTRREVLVEGLEPTSPSFESVDGR